MSQLQTLYDLQQFDTEIREKKQQLGEVLQAQKENAALLAARQQVETAEAQLQTARATHKNLSLELGSVNDKARRSEQRLYSGDVKNPKELTDLQHEIESLGRRRDTLETDVLEALMAVEEQEATLQTDQVHLDKLTAAREESLKSLKAEQQKLAVRLVQLGQLRDKKAAKVTPAMLSTYERLAKQKGGVGVVELKNGKCMGCQVSVPEHRIKDIDRGNIVYCDNCGRILCAR